MEPLWIGVIGYAIGGLVCARIYAKQGTFADGHEVIEGIAKTLPPEQAMQIKGGEIIGQFVAVLFWPLIVALGVFIAIKMIKAKRQ